MLKFVERRVRVKLGIAGRQNRQQFQNVFLGHAGVLQQAENAVPYGKGGQTTLPSGFSDFPGPANGGIAVQGPGGGDFASRYGWYIEAVKRAVNQNWMQNTIDPSIRAARRAKTTITFTINRDGSIKSIRVAESSGNRSMDDSAQRALLSIDHFPPLPSDYSGRYVDVIFDFDLTMSK